MEKEPLLARIISVLLHPLLMATYSVCLLFVYTDFQYIYAGRFWLFVLPVLIATCLLPANGVFLLKKAGIVEDYDLKKREERLYPILICVVFYALLLYYFYRGGAIVWYLALMASPVIALIIGGLITLFWKISFHMIGIGGLIGGVLSVSYNVKWVNPYILFIILFILAGCLGTSRIILKRHTPMQVYAGFSLGFAVVYLAVYLSVVGVFTYFQ